MCGRAGYVSNQLSQEIGYLMAITMKHRETNHQGAVVIWRLLMFQMWKKENM